MAELAKPRRWLWSRWTSPSTRRRPQLVMASLGDSFQSGEGAGFSYDDEGDYGLFAYLEGTYITLFQPGGNGCHRSPVNYPHQVADRLRRDYDLTLVDVTCSGSQIISADTPIVGTAVGAPPADDSQIAQVINELDGLDPGPLHPGEVDLLTVGMGGNDAKFSSLVYSCLIPTLMKKLVAAYEGEPFSVWLAGQAPFACQFVDSIHFHTGSAIDQLAAKEDYARDQIREAFPHAAVYQLTYPNLLPEDPPPWCGGISPGDVGYARDKTVQINDIIRADASGITIVDVQDAFGANPLCPTDPGDALANGISEANLDAELARLLADPEVAPALTDVVDDIDALLPACANPIQPWCPALWENLKQSGAVLAEVLHNELQITIPNLIAPSWTEYGAKDRMRGLFHPNAAGASVLACRVSVALRVPC